MTFQFRVFLIGLVVLIGSVAACAVARAGEAEVSWTHPTTFVGGAPIPANGLSATEINYGVCNATKTGFLTTPAPVTVSVPFPTAERTITNLGTASWCFRARSLTVGTTPTPSDWTNFVFKDIIDKPLPPVLTVR